MAYNIKKKKTYYGVMFSEFDKSMTKLKTKSDFKPSTETAGFSATAKWVKSKKEQDSLLEYGKKLGYK